MGVMHQGMKMVSGNFLAPPCLSDLGHLAVLGLDTGSHCRKIKITFIIEVLLFPQLQFNFLDTMLAHTFCAVSAICLVKQIKLNYNVCAS